MAHMVALLRARGSFSIEEVAGAFQLSERTIDELSEDGNPAVDRAPTWTREALAREVRRFFRREGRWPTSKDFRSMNMRRKGLPAWEGVGVIMTGESLRNISPWNWWTQDRRRRVTRQLREEGLVLRGEQLPDNGWVILQRWMVLHEDLTPAEILALPNTLIRREGMEKYGLEQMVEEGFGEFVSEDSFGKLWRFPGERKNEPLMMAEVVNSTPEPDGSFAHYFLRVPPNMEWPQQAIAWSFGVTEGWEDFKMVVET